LAETVVGIAELISAQHARMKVTSGPVRGKRRRMQQCLQETDHPIIMDLQTWDATLPDQGRFG
jgi:hypothetical protein